MKTVLGLLTWWMLAFLRFLGIVGIIGLIAYPFGWWRHYVWLWLLFLAVGIITAKLIDDAKKDIINSRH